MSTTEATQSSEIMNVTENFIFENSDSINGKYFILFLN
jgi:hypothetical protein